MLEPGLLLWLKLCCAFYHVEPEFALAVAKVESGNKHHEFRVGRLGRSRYFGPMGINECFMKRWPIDDPYENVRVGVAALRGQSKLRVLRRYNASCDHAYVQAVIRNYKHFKKEMP